MLIIYKSAYGTAKAYAEYLANKQNTVAIEASNVDIHQMSENEEIIFFAGFYGPKLNGIDLIINNWQTLANKKITICTTSLVDPEIPENKAKLQEYLKMTLPEEVLKGVEVINLAGAIDYKKMTLPHKLLMTALWLKTKLTSRKKWQPEDYDIVNTYGKTLNRVNFNKLERWH